MAKRRYSKRRTSKRRYKRRTSYRKRRTSYRKRRTSYRKRSYRRRRASPRASGHYTRPCPPGFTRGPTGHCTGSKYNIPQYVNPTFSSAIRNAKTGSNLGFKSRYASLADAFKAREGKAAPFSLTRPGTGSGWTGPAMTRDASGHFAGGRRRLF